MKTRPRSRRNIRVASSLSMVLVLASQVLAQDVSPLRPYHVWLPMTGVSEAQMDDARAAGFDTLMLKIHPPLTDDGTGIDPQPHEKTLAQATAKGFKLVLPILGWVGLGDGRFWDVSEDGKRIANRLDPFRPEAMRRIEWYFGQVIDHYKTNPHVVAFAPTWGIYGEAGFTSWTAGRSPHALARFNEWRQERGLSVLDALPTRKDGPNTEFNRFIRFRFLYMESRFDAMIGRLKARAAGLPVGMWQELYPGAGYLWNMVEVPSADFALYESCFAYQTVHHPEKSLAETMGFRYRCTSADDYRNYYLPLLARKRGEGQRFMGCQLSNDYAKNYGWTKELAVQRGFDQWEDRFSPYLEALHGAYLESPVRDVLLVFPTYAAAAWSDHPSHTADTKLIDTLLRMYGCQMARYGSPRFDKLSEADLNRFRLIVVPCAAYLTPQTYAKLEQTTATVLFTGCFAQSFDARRTPFGGARELDGTTLAYGKRPAGEVTVAADHELTRSLRERLARQPVRLVADESFRYDAPPDDVTVLLRCGIAPLLSVRDSGHFVFIHGHLFATSCVNKSRKPPSLLSSKDGSANEHDPWGSYDSAHPRNWLGRMIVKTILDHSRADYRVPAPRPRGNTPFLGDHMEPASISANLVYNNTAEPQTLTIRTPYAVRGLASVPVKDRYETDVTVPPFFYVVLEPRP